MKTTRTRPLASFTRANEIALMVTVAISFIIFLGLIVLFLITQMLEGMVSTALCLSVSTGIILYFKDNGKGVFIFWHRLVRNMSGGSKVKPEVIERYARRIWHNTNKIPGTITAS